MRFHAAVFLLCLLASAGMSSAAPAVVVDGVTLAAAPVNCQGTLLLPVRPVFDASQAQLRWFPKEQKLEARRGERLVELWIGTPVAQMDRVPVQLNTPPLLRDGVTYVPLRLVAEAFGGTVQWEPSRNRVVISTSRQSSESPE